MDTMVSGTREGWFEDPAGIADLRYFDGTVWTGQTKSLTPAAPAKPSAPPAGWYKDPAGTDSLRYFDGSAWGQVTRSPDSFKDEVDAVPDPRLAAALSFSSSKDEVPGSTALRLGRRSLADHARTESVLAPTVVEKSSKKLSFLMILGGVAVLVYALYVTVGTNIIGDWGQKSLREEYAAAAATVEPVVPVETPAATPDAVVPTPEAPAPAPEPVAPAVPAFNRDPMPVSKAAGEATGIIKIPAIGMDQVFVSGTQIPDLKKGPGIWEYGSFPGTPGNATISGHRTTYGGPFRKIDQLKVGDRITISVAGQPDAVFEVRGSLIVEPSRIEVTNDAGGVRLTLTTCEPVGSDAERLVVQAELVEGAWLDHALPADQWQIMS